MNARAERWARGSFVDALRDIEQAATQAAKDFGAAYARYAESARVAREAVEAGLRVCVRCWSSDVVFVKADAGGFYLDESPGADELVRMRPRDVCDGCIRGFEISNKPRV